MLNKPKHPRVPKGCTKHLLWRCIRGGVVIKTMMMTVSVSPLLSRDQFGELLPEI